MNRKIVLAVFVSMCFLSAMSLTQFVVSVKANPYTNVSVSKAKEMIDTNPDLVILDVRYLYEYDDGHIKNAILIPLPELGGRIGELDKEKEILVYCKLGGRSASACATLDAAGFTNVYNMLGGITDWRNAGYPIEIVFDVILEEKPYPVATFSNSTISSFAFSQPLKQVGFNVDGPSGTIGFCNVTIPNELLGGPYTVLVDDQPPASLILTENATHASLYFTYIQSLHAVRIVGTVVVDTTPPVADAGPDQTVDVGTPMTFDGSGSSDNVGIVSYEWDFENGNKGTGQITMHAYMVSGTYVVTLTVWDAAGNNDTDSLTVTVKELALPVGGRAERIVIPVNKPDLLTSWMISSALAIIPSLVIAVVFVKLKKKKQ